MRWIGDGTGRTTWRDVHILYLVAEPGSAISRITQSDSQWGLQEQLLATIGDRLAILAWQKTEHGQKGRNPPKPIPRPGLEENTTENGVATEKIGEAIPAVDVAAMFAVMWAPQPEPQLTKQQAIELYSHGGTTYKDLATRCNVSPSTIGRWIRSTQGNQ